MRLQVECDYREHKFIVYQKRQI